MKDENIKEKIKAYYVANDIDKIIDYITNLQTIEQQYSAILSENAELENKLKETADLCSKHFVKIQTLKEELKSANESITWWQNRFNSVERDNKDYKSRCEKTTKLLKQAGSYDEETKQFCDDVWEELPDILNVLEGVDE